MIRKTVFYKWRVITNLPRALQQHKPAKDQIFRLGEIFVSEAESNICLTDGRYPALHLSREYNSPGPALVDSMAILWPDHEVDRAQDIFYSVVISSPTPEYYGHTFRTKTNIPFERGKLYLSDEEGMSLIGLCKPWKQLTYVKTFTNISQAIKFCCMANGITKYKGSRLIPAEV